MHIGIATILRDPPHYLMDLEAQSVNVKTCMLVFFHTSSVFI